MNSSLPDPMNDPLAGLLGYRLPEPIGWWPPAAGWWWLAFALVLLCCGLAWLYWRRRRRCATLRAAQRELEGLRRAAATGAAAPGLVRELSKLLRRYAMVVYPRAEVAGLSGEAWLHFLDRHGGAGRFAAGVGRELVQAPYRADADAPAAELLELVADWMQRNPGGCR